MMQAAGMAGGQTRYAALLRGINLGNRRLKMDELRAHLEAVPGLENVATYIASGNVVFDHGHADLAALESLIERHLGEALGYDVDTFVRPLGALAAIAALPALEGVREDGFRPHVIFLRHEPGDDVAGALAALETAEDRFQVGGREVVWLRRGRLTDSPITQTTLEKALGGIPNTMRNLNTIERMVARFGD